MYNHLQATALNKRHCLLILYNKSLLPAIVSSRPVLWKLITAEMCEYKSCTRKKITLKITQSSTSKIRESSPRNNQNLMHKEFKSGVD